MQYTNATHALKTSILLWEYLAKNPGTDKPTAYADLGLTLEEGDMDLSECSLCEFVSQQIPMIIPYYSEKFCNQCPAAVEFKAAQTTEPNREYSFCLNAMSPYALWSEAMEVSDTTDIANSANAMVELLNNALERQS